MYFWFILGLKRPILTYLAFLPAIIGHFRDIFLQNHSVPPVEFLSSDDFCDEDDLCDDRCEDFNPVWCEGQNSRKKRQAPTPPPNAALEILENYGCWCSKMFTGFALMGEVLDDTDSLCREFSRCWRCIGMMECEGDLAEAYTRIFL